VGIAGAATFGCSGFDTEVGSAGFGGACGSTALAGAAEVSGFRGPSLATALESSVEVTGGNAMEPVPAAVVATGASERTLSLVGFGDSPVPSGCVRSRALCR